MEISHWASLKRGPDFSSFDQKFQKITKLGVFNRKFFYFKNPFSNAFVFHKKSQLEFFNK